MVGSLKKGSKASNASLSLPASAAPGSSNAYNTLPSQHHLRAATSSPRFIAASAGVGVHKRSPSSDSGHGTLHHHLQASANTPGSRSHTPVSLGQRERGGAAGAAQGTPAAAGPNNGAKVHHTVYLHGKGKKSKDKKCACLLLPIVWCTTIKHL